MSADKDQLPASFLVSVPVPKPMMPLSVAVPVPLNVKPILVEVMLPLNASVPLLLDASIVLALVDIVKRRSDVSPVPRYCKVAAPDVPIEIVPLPAVVGAPIELLPPLTLFILEIAKVP